MAIFNYTSFSGGLNMGVGDFGKPQNELSISKNVQEDKIGILKRVPGYTKATTNVVNAADETVNFLHSYYRTATQTRNLLAGGDNGSDYVLKYREASGDWAAITGGTYTGLATASMTAVNYLNKTFIVGYKPSPESYLSPATFQNTTLTTSSATDADLTGMPGGKFIVKYRDLLYVLNCYVGSTVYRARAYFCGDPVSGALPTSAPAGWTDPIPGSWQWPTTVNFIDFGQDDGEGITGAAECVDRLVVFTRNAMWTWDENNRKKISDIGCDNHKTIHTIGGVLYWANRDGIWRWDGGIPQLISSKVQPFFDQVTTAILSGMVGVAFEFEYRLYIGDMTVNGSIFNNAWIVFDIRREKFYIRCTFDPAYSATTYIDATGYERIYFGGAVGFVYKMSTYIDGINEDNEQEIDWFFETNKLDFGAAQIVKSISQICFYTENQGAMKYIIDGNNSGEFTISRGQIKTNRITPLEVDAKGYRFGFKFYGKDRTDPFEFEGFVIEANALENG